MYKKAQVAWAGLSMEQLLEELDQIVQFAVLYPPQDEKVWPWFFRKRRWPS